MTNDHDHSADAAAVAVEATEAALVFPLQMQYRAIDRQTQDAMIGERVAALEREHFAKQLLLWENQGRPAIERELLIDMEEIRRRIEIHIGAPAAQLPPADEKQDEQQGEQDEPELIGTPGLAEHESEGDPATNGNRAARRAARRTQ